jgi:hypothetical protein
MSRCGFRISSRDLNVASTGTSVLSGGQSEAR